MKEFKIRASKASCLMGAKGLGETGKSYVKEWYKEQLYGKKKEFSNKFIKKGIINEEQSLQIIADYLDLGFVFKNEQFYENEFMHGTPDLVLKNLIIDVKNSWDLFTFPLFDTEIKNESYIDQLNVYMNLTGVPKAKLIYTLTDTPDFLIEKEARKYCFENGIEDLDLDVYDEFLQKMTYSNIPIDLRVKVFDLEYSLERNNKLESRVVECRDYLNSILITK